MNRYGYNTVAKEPSYRCTTLLTDTSVDVPWRVSSDRSRTLALCR